MNVRVNLCKFVMYDFVDKLLYKRMVVCIYLLRFFRNRESKNNCNLWKWRIFCVIIIYIVNR